MINGTTATFTVAFRQQGCPPSSKRPSLSQLARVTRFLALAHEIERRVRTGELDDLAHAARVFGLTRARVTQITNLLLLAPDIQAEILALTPVTAGRDPITERTLRPIVAEPNWEVQIAHFERFAAPRLTSILEKPVNIRRRDAEPRGPIDARSR